MQIETQASKYAAFSLLAAYPNLNHEHVVKWVSLGRETSSGLVDSDQLEGLDRTSAWSWCEAAPRFSLILEAVPWFTLRV